MSYATWDNSTRDANTASWASTEQSGEASAHDQHFKPRTSRARVPKRELVNLTSQLAIMIRSGVDVAGALQSLARQCRRPGLKDILEQIHEDVMGGKAFSESLRTYAHVFGGSYVASIAAGEASGRLPDVLGQLTRLQRNDLRLRNSVRTMMAYPVLLTAVSGLVILALVLFVLPQFAEIFKQNNTPLPMITLAFLGVSNELWMRFWLWIPLFIGAMIGATLVRRSEAGRRCWDRLMLNLVIIRDVTRSLLIGRTCRLLGLMIDSGVPLLESLRLARSAVANSLYRDLFAELEQEVLNGRSLGNGLLESAFVPPAAAEMVLTAERTGTLGTVTQLIGEHFEEEGETRLRELVAVLEPAITIGMGIVVACVVLSVALPMFDLSSVGQ